MRWYLYLCLMLSMCVQSAALLQLTAALTVSEVEVSDSRSDAVDSRTHRGDQSSSLSSSYDSMTPATTNYEPSVGSSMDVEVSFDGSGDAASVSSDVETQDEAPTTDVDATAARDGLQVVPAVDSDYFFLDVLPSQLPVAIGASNRWQGVFATQKIHAGSVICEYRGNVIRSTDLLLMRKDGDRTGTVDLIGLDGAHYVIMGDNICSLILDCTAAVHRSFDRSEIDALDQGEQHHLINCLAPFEHNAYFMRESGKVFVAASRDIEPHEEIYLNYGWYVACCYT